MSRSPANQEVGIGKNIAGYIISSTIGRGRFSTVYKAHKNRGNYEVSAIKCIEISTLSAIQKKDYLSLEEVKILKRIDHEHIVSLKQYTWGVSYLYLILEYCPGGTLAELIKKKGRLNICLFQHFAQQLVQGLRVLNSLNIIHRDIKPANILLSTPAIGSCRNVKLKLADFGLSRQLTNNEKSITGLRGTPLYMAPEVLKLQPYNSQADLFSLGITLYECLFGHTPYKATDLDSITKQIHSSDPFYVPRIKGMSDICYDLIKQLLVKEQDKRMNFYDLFRHEFIDMQHRPTEENYYKGVLMVREATKLDNLGSYEYAREFYIEGLLYLVPAYHWLDSFNDNQRRWLSRRIQEYCNRAERITSSLKLSGLKIGDRFNCEEITGPENPRQFLNGSLN